MPIPPKAICFSPDESGVTNQACEWRAILRLPERSHTNARGLSFSSATSPKPWAKLQRRCYTVGVDESRKRVLLMAASILAARKLAQIDSRPSPAREAAIAKAIENCRTDHAADRREVAARKNYEVAALLTLS
jgi:hypothetical protein